MANHSYFVVMIDYGRNGLEAIVQPEITRREIVSRIRSGEYERERIAFIHSIHDGICEVVTDELIEAAGMPPEEPHIESMQAKLWDHKRALMKETA